MVISRTLGESCVLDPIRCFLTFLVAFSAVFVSCAIMCASACTLDTFVGFPQAFGSSECCHAASIGNSPSCCSDDFRYVYSCIRIRFRLRVDFEASGVVCKMFKGCNCCIPTNCVDAVADIGGQRRGWRRTAVVLLIYEFPCFYGVIKSLIATREH